jgi:hypothetical protein
VSLTRLTFSVFLVLQAADGLMTYGAASVFGAAAEGNPFLALWMESFGIGPALLAAKLLACACGLLLYWRGVHRPLAVLTALYTFGAVIPWLYLLASGTF